MFVLLLSKATIDRNIVKFYINIKLLCIGSLKKSIYEFFKCKENSLKNYPLVICYIKNSEKTIYIDNINSISDNIKKNIQNNYQVETSIFISGSESIEIKFNIPINDKLYIKDIQNKITLSISNTIMSIDKIHKYISDKNNESFYHTRLADKYISRHVVSNLVENSNIWFYKWKQMYSKSSKDLEVIRLFYSIEE
jgi:hypothetical protein